MDDNKIPELERSHIEMLSQLRGIWDEISKLTDWLWQLERNVDHIDERLTMIEKQYANLRRDVEGVIGKRTLSIFKEKR